jgi:predicted glycosyltransferase involved in capsule biosynthesis
MSYKISFYTTCMGRLKHLKRTLPQNLKDNLDYSNCEFIILDYNSQDGLKDWMKDNMQEYINSRKVKYFRTTEPRYFHHNHAKNMAAKQSTGDILCGIDADNFTALGPEGMGLAKKLNQLFQERKEENVFVRAQGWDDRELPWTSSMTYRYYSSSGKIATRKKDFFAAGGYNEALKGHYFDEEEFWQRLKQVWNFNHIKLPAEYSKAINHSNYERLKNLSPELIDLKELREKKIENPSKVNQSYMKQEWVKEYYPNGLKNAELMQTILKKKIKNPNGENWGEGKIK